MAYTNSNKISAKNRILKMRYGITYNEYIMMFNNQNGKCAICGEERPSTGKNGLYVDHSHKTNIVRGLLCPNCNSAIGKFKEDIGILYNAIEYIKNYV